MNKSLWQKILNIVITVLTAIATTFGVTSCMGVYSHTKSFPLAKGGRGMFLRTCDAIRTGHPLAPFTRGRLKF